jgi:hypothetical protein
MADKGRLAAVGVASSKSRNAKTAFEAGMENWASAQVNARMEMEN